MIDPNNEGNNEAIILRENQGVKIRLSLEYLHASQVVQISCAETISFACMRGELIFDGYFYQYVRSQVLDVNHDVWLLLKLFAN